MEKKRWKKDVEVRQKEGISIYKYSLWHLALSLCIFFFLLYLLFYLTDLLTYIVRKKDRKNVSSQTKKKKNLRRHARLSSTSSFMITKIYSCFYDVCPRVYRMHGVEARENHVYLRTATSRLLYAPEACPTRLHVRRNDILTVGRDLNSPNPTVSTSAVSCLSPLLTMQLFFFYFFFFSLFW